MIVKTDGSFAAQLCTNLQQTEPPLLDPRSAVFGHSMARWPDLSQRKHTLGSRPPPEPRQPGRPRRGGRSCNKPWSLVPEFLLVLLLTAQVKQKREMASAITESVTKLIL